MRLCSRSVSEPTTQLFFTLATVAEKGKPNGSAPSTEWTATSTERAAGHSKPTYRMDCRHSSDRAHRCPIPRNPQSCRAGSVSVTKFSKREPAW